MNKKSKNRGATPDRAAGNIKRPAIEKSRRRRTLIQKFARAYGFIF